MYFRDFSGVDTLSPLKTKLDSAMSAMKSGIPGAQQKVAEAKAAIEAAKINAEKLNLTAEHWKKLEEFESGFNAAIEKLEEVKIPTGKGKYLSRIADIIVITAFIGLVGSVGVLMYIMRKKKKEETEDTYIRY